MKNKRHAKNIRYYIPVGHGDAERADAEAARVWLQCDAGDGVARYQELGLCEGHCRRWVQICAAHKCGCTHD